MHSVASRRNQDSSPQRAQRLSISSLRPWRPLRFKILAVVIVLRVILYGCKYLDGHDQYSTYKRKVKKLPLQRARTVFISSQYNDAGAHGSATSGYTYERSRTPL